MGITIKRAVRVKIVVTEAFKKQRSAEIRSALTKLEAVRKRLEFEAESAARLEKSGQSSAALERLRGSLRKNEETRAALRAELDKVAGLDLGTEFDGGTLEGYVEVEVGDEFSRIASCEIVVDNDRVIEIRDGLCLETSETS